MELTPRKQAVLKAIVKAYIETGEPIGSKNLTALIDNAPSSATLRNEMSELCELGFLHQPHTSAGRIPTSSGYRLYVNSLMNKPPLSKETEALIDNEFSEIHSEPESIPAAAAQILSRITGLPAISCLMTERPARIKRIELLPIGRFSVMLLIITDDGRTRNRIFRQGKNFTKQIENEFYDIVSRKIKGKPISELTKPYIQGVIAEAGFSSLELMPLLSAVFETALEIEETDLTLQGENTLYNIFGSEEKIAKVMSLIKRRDPIISILENIEDNVGAVFGADTEYNELQKDTIIAAKFSGGDKYKGYIGIIGPNRISYDKIMPGIEYTAQKLTKLITEAQKDMED